MHSVGQPHMKWKLSGLATNTRKQQDACCSKRIRVVKRTVFAGDKRPFQCIEIRRSARMK